MYPLFPCSQRVHALASLPHGVSMSAHVLSAQRTCVRLPEEPLEASHVTTCECVQPKHTHSLHPWKNWLLIPQFSPPDLFLRASLTSIMACPEGRNWDLRLCMTVTGHVLFYSQCLGGSTQTVMELDSLSYMRHTCFNNCSPPSHSPHILTRSLTAISGFLLHPDVSFSRGI